MGQMSPEPGPNRLNGPRTRAQWLQMSRDPGPMNPNGSRTRAQWKQMSLGQARRRVLDPTLRHWGTYLYVYIGGGGESNRESVSFRWYVRTRGLVVEWNFASNVRGALFPFPFQRGSAFPSSLVRVQCVLVSSSEFK